MAKFVPAWDKRTGRQLPNQVPQKWLDKGIFKNLSATKPTAPRTTASVTGGKSDQKGA